MTAEYLIHHQGLRIRILTPNALCYWRARTFSSKEPETLEWIDSIPEKSILWDIGANIGLYSIYAAKRRDCRVFSFEPSVFNQELLARNVFLNNLVDKVCIIPLPLSDKLGFSQMRMTSVELGGALSTFDRKFGWDGSKLDEVFKFTTLGVSMNLALSHLNVPRPDYIKMDVDGLEHIILGGGQEVLSTIQGILLEVNDRFYEQASVCEEILTGAGFVRIRKVNSELVSKATTGFQYCFNQIWIRG
jgi:FkbM family methyltransferase